MADGDRLILRSPTWVRWTASVLAVIVLLFLVLVAVRPTVGRFILFALVFVVFLPNAALVARRAEIGAEGVRLAGRRRISWADIDRMEVSGADPVVVTRSGRRLPLPGRCDPRLVRPIAPSSVEVR